MQDVSIENSLSLEDIEVLRDIFRTLLDWDEELNCVKKNTNDEGDNCK